MSKLVSVKGDLYRNLCQNAVPRNDAQKSELAILKKSADTGVLKNYVIKRTSLDSLESMQPGGKHEPPKESATPAVPASPVPAVTAANNDAGSADVTAPRPAAKLTLVESVRALDPANADHWTNGGQPAMKAVEELFGKSVTRANVDEVAPGYDRETARVAAG